MPTASATLPKLPNPGAQKTRASASARLGPDLRSLRYSPDVNPLISPREVTVRQRHVRTGTSQTLVNTATGEVAAIAAHHIIEEVDDAQFVKVFAAGIKAIYDLSRTAVRVFHVVLEVYQGEPMSGGFADSIYLASFQGLLNGKALGMSDDTWQRGLKELLAKGFLAPRQPSLFWVNPNMFFKGDRVLFLREYVRKSSSADQRKREELEAHGQARLLPED